MNVRMYDSEIHHCTGGGHPSPACFCTQDQKVGEIGHLILLQTGGCWQRGRVCPAVDAQRLLECSSLSSGAEGSRRAWGEWGISCWNTSC